MLTEDRRAVFSYQVHKYSGGRESPAARVGRLTAHCVRRSPVRRPPCSRPPGSRLASLAGCFARASHRLTAPCDRRSPVRRSRFAHGSLRSPLAHFEASLQSASRRSTSRSPLAPRHSLAHGSLRSPFAHSAALASLVPPGSRLALTIHPVRRSSLRVPDPRITENRCPASCLLWRRCILVPVVVGLGSTLASMSG